MIRVVMLISNGSPVSFISKKFPTKSCTSGCVPPLCQSAIPDPTKKGRPVLSVANADMMVTFGDVPKCGIGNLELLLSPCGTVLLDQISCSSLLEGTVIINVQFLYLVLEIRSVYLCNDLTLVFCRRLY